MEWISCIKNSIDYIEDNIKSIRSIEEVCNKVHVSSYYLQTGFQIMTGYSLGEYIRNRKLYLAALSLLANNSVTDVSFDYGYETVESFSKAFKRFHGFNPSKVKDNNIKVFLPLTIDISIHGGEQMELKYKITNMFPIKLIGFVKEFNFETSYQEIPKFWDEICEKYCYPRIYQGLEPINDYEKAIIDNCIGEFGVCIDSCGGKFKYMIAGRYCGGIVPDGMEIYEFNKGEWAIFDSFGPIPTKLQELNTRIFKEFLPFNKDFELREDSTIEWYDCINGEKTDSNYHSQIWLPIKRIK